MVAGSTCIFCFGQLHIFDGCIHGIAEQAAVLAVSGHTGNNFVVAIKITLERCIISTYWSPGGNVRQVGIVGV